MHKKVHLKISLDGADKNVPKCEEKDVFYAEVVDPLYRAIKGASEGILEGAPQDALSDLHKDVQDSAFEIALKGEIEAAFELLLWLHLFMQ